LKKAAIIRQLQLANAKLEEMKNQAEYDLSDIKPNLETKNRRTFENGKNKQQSNKRTTATAATNNKEGLH